MKALGKISIIAMLLAVSISAQAEFKRVGQKHTDSSSVAAMPKVLNAPVTITAGGKPDTYTVETELFITTCGVVKTSMAGVSSADVLATISALQSQDEIPGLISSGREFMREVASNGVVKCRIDNVERFTFLVNGCSGVLSGETRREGPIKEGTAVCDQAFLNFTK